MVFSAVLRRWTLRSIKAATSIAGTPPHSLSVSWTAVTATSINEPAPWLMIRPTLDYLDRSSFKFYSLEDEKIHSFFPDDNDCDGGGCIVGSSQGWMVLYDAWENHGVGLLDPTKGRSVKLPAIGGVLHRLIVAEKERLY